MLTKDIFKKCKIIEKVCHYLKWTCCPVYRAGCKEIEDKKWQKVSEFNLKESKEDLIRLNIYETIANDLALKDNLLEETSLISKTDSKGLIIYANDKFLETAGYTWEEFSGQDHKIVNSGFHSKEVWRDMYKTTVKDKLVWHHPKIVNRRKDGSLYYVKSWIQALFDSNDNLKGFVSVRHDITDLVIQQEEVDKKNAYLEHAAKILRHDMHSGINTYIPRGVASLKRRLSTEAIKKLRLEPPIKLIEDGLKHTQKVYKGAYQFSILVKPNAILETKKINLKSVLENYLNNTAYKDQVYIDKLPEINANESLFCTAIDNLIRNGLKYNDSKSKIVKIYFDQSTNCLIVEDNGRGISQKEFDILKKPYARGAGQKEKGTGLGLNICAAILEQHNFKISCEKLESPTSGTRIKIYFNK